MSNLAGFSYDKQFQNEIEFLVLFYKTFRAYYISLFYLANKKYTEAVGFIFRVENYVKTVQTNMKSFEKKEDLGKPIKEYEDQLNILIAELNQSKYKIQTAALLEVNDENQQNNLKENLEKIVRYLFKIFYENRINFNHKTL
jgi:hypothetical protein